MVKKSVGLNDAVILNIVKSEIVDYSRFENRQLKVIGLPPHTTQDSVVCDHYSYTQWIALFSAHKAIKVEGLENNHALMRMFSKFRPIDIHLFVSQQLGYSFKWHADDLNVFLYVVKGKKWVEIQNKRYVVNAGQGIFIPRGHIHRVRSKHDTWALSIGFK